MDEPKRYEAITVDIGEDLADDFADEVLCRFGAAGWRVVGGPVWSARSVAWFVVMEREADRG